MGRTDSIHGDGRRPREVPGRALLGPKLAIYALDAFFGLKCIGTYIFFPSSLPLLPRRKSLDYGFCTPRKVLNPCQDEFALLPHALDCRMQQRRVDMRRVTEIDCKIFYIFVTCFNPNVSI